MVIILYLATGTGIFIINSRSSWYSPQATGYDDKEIWSSSNHLRQDDINVHENERAWLDSRAAMNFNFRLCFGNGCIFEAIINKELGTHTRGLCWGWWNEWFGVLVQRSTIRYYWQHNGSFPLYFYRRHPTDHRLNQTPRSTRTTMDDQHRLHSLIYAFTWPATQHEDEEASDGFQRMALSKKLDVSLDMEATSLYGDWTMSTRQG